MAKPHVVTGRLMDERTVLLDEALPLSPSKLRLVVEPLPTEVCRPYQDVMADIRRRQKARSHRPATPEEIDHYLRGERESWGE